MISFYTIKTLGIFKKMFPQYVWQRPNTDKKTLYLTFDDGPTPNVTERILEILKTYHVPATFFLLGEKVQKNPDIVSKILADHHAIGNHSYSHLNGWWCNTGAYLQDVYRAAQILPKTKLFRPPYGKITKYQAQKLIEKGYKIVMWDVMSGDFDRYLSVKKSYSKIIKHTKNGSVIVFHDLIKSKKKVLDILPRLIEQWKNDGYSFSKL